MSYKIQSAITGIMAFIYYALLSARDWTWVFVSYDSGDWLTAANWWIVPQPYGSPLYITLCRLFGLLPGNQASNISLLLSAIPAAITVALVYLIVVRLTGRRLIAAISSAVLLASAIFLTQATVVEEYTLATMFLTLAVYFRLYTRPYLCATAIALGSAVHVVVLLISFLWLAADMKYWKQHFGAVITSGLVVGVSYSLILVLMYLDTPRLFAGGLNFKSLMEYLRATGGNVVGQLSIQELPQRLWDMIRIMIMSLGLALIPLTCALKQKVVHIRFVLLAVIFATFGYYLMSLDYTTWTFLTFAMPSLAVLTGIGLNKLQPYHTKLVVVSCMCLLVLNGIFMNANTLTNNNPIARSYYNDLASLPSGSVVVTHAGAYSMGTFYAMSRGIEIIPLVFPYLDWWEFEDYRLWLFATYNMYIPPKISTVEAIKYLLDDGRDLYFAYYPSRTSDIQNTLVLKGTGTLRKVISVR